MDRKIFEFTIDGLTYYFEFFSMEYIKNALDALGLDYFVLDLNKAYRKALKDIAFEDEEKEKYHFLTFIRFFEENDVQYGIVGGKTTYLYPDVHPGKEMECEKRYSRLFVRENNRRWHDKVIVINHSENLERAVDESHSLFTECFIQRKFNLFDS